MKTDADDAGPADHAGPEAARDPGWPVQVRLPGQTAAPDGPLDMTAMHVMHHGFRRDLRDFAQATQVTPVGDRVAWRALHDRWDLFAEVLHHHHTGEDAGLWPVLRERAAGAEVETLHAMETEHGEIDPLLASCAAGFMRLAEYADDDTRAALAVRVTAARERMGHHLRHEETEAIVLAQTYLTGDEWTAIEVEHFRSGVSVRMAARLVPWAAYELPSDVLRRVLGGADPGFRLLHRLTRRGFAKRHAVAFRHVRAAGGIAHRWTTGDVS